MMKALDFVKTPKGNIAIITETTYGGERASIDFIGKQNPNGERNAWWKKEELEVVDSLPRLLASNIAHPFGHGKDDVKLFFKVEG